LEDDASEVRLFNNWVKAELINLYCKNAHVLDAAFGRGGDYQKYQHARVKSLTGYDISQESLNEAHNRYGGPTLAFKTICHDFTRPITINSPLAAPDTFDIATCFFAAHYACEGEDSMVHFLDSTIGKLGDGYNSRLVMICPNEQRVKAWSHTEHPFCSITPTPDSNAYTFTLSHSVRGCEEFYVPLDRLEKLAMQKYGYGIVRCENMLNYPGAQNQLYQRMKVPARLSEYSKVVINLFDILVFAKINY
jgi:SAM-dependent methyltransferase